MYTSLYNRRKFTVHCKLIYYNFTHHVFNIYYIIIYYYNILFFTLHISNSATLQDRTFWLCFTLHKK